LAPAIGTLPESGVPPVTTNRSMRPLPKPSLRTTPAEPLLRR